MSLSNSLVRRNMSPARRHFLQWSSGSALGAALLVGPVAWGIAAAPSAHAQGAGTQPVDWRRALLLPGHLVVMRHAIAPGVGDPPGLRIGDCSTQRNLSDEGREQARQIGEQLRAAGLRAADVRSSQWCRCMDTARALGLGPVRELDLLNSFFGDQGARQTQTQALRRWIARADLSRPLVLVTHQVNMTELTGSHAASGEFLVLRRGPGGAVEMVARSMP